MLCRAGCAPARPLPPLGDLRQREVVMRQQHGHASKESQRIACAVNENMYAGEAAQQETRRMQYTPRRLRRISRWGREQVTRRRHHAAGSRTKAVHARTHTDKSQNVHGGAWCDVYRANHTSCPLSRLRSERKDGDGPSFASASMMSTARPRPPCMATQGARSKKLRTQPRARARATNVEVAHGSNVAGSSKAGRVHSY